MEFQKGNGSKSDKSKRYRQLSSMSNVQVIQKLAVFGRGDYRPTEKMGHIEMAVAWASKMLTNLKEMPDLYKQHDILVQAMDADARRNLWSMLEDDKLKGVKQRVPKGLRGPELTDDLKHRRLLWTKKFFTLSHVYVQSVDPACCICRKRRI